MKKRIWITSLINNRNACYLKKTHKFGIEVPKSIAHAYAQDENNGNTIWQEAFTKEINDMIPDFGKLDHGEIIPIGY